MSNSARRIAALVAAGFLLQATALAAEKPAKMGLGRPALPEEISAWDIDVRAGAEDQKMHGRTDDHGA